MLNKCRKSKHGFTLIELVIAMSILTMVIGLGYKVLNKSSESTENQKNTFNIQQGINILKKFANQDFKNCKYVSIKYNNQNTEDIKTNIGIENNILNVYEYIANEIDNNISYSYEYILNNDDSSISYIISTNRKGKNIYYSIIRKDTNSEIDIISNQKLHEKNMDYSIPLDIRHNNKIFYITMNYMNRKDTSSYIFSIYNQITNITGINPKPDEEESGGDSGENSGGGSGNGSGGNSDGGSGNGSEGNLGEDSEEDENLDSQPDQGSQFKVDGYLKYCIQMANDRLELALSQWNISNNYPNLNTVKKSINDILIKGQVSEKELKSIIEVLDDNKVIDNAKYHQSVNNQSESSVGDCISKSQIYLDTALYVLKHLGQNAENHETHDNIPLNQKLDSIKSSNIDNYTDNFLRNELKNFDSSKIDNYKIEPIAIKLKELIPLIGNIQNNQDKNNNLQNINKYIDIIIQAQVDTINVYKTIDYIPENHKNRISGLNLAIQRLIEIKCDLGDVNYYSI